MSIWTAFLFFLPAGIANATPVIACKLPWLKNWSAPLDFGKTYRGKRVFGANKTWRGLLSGMAMGALTASLLYAGFESIRDISDSLWVHASLGALMGFGALAGDAIESFIKRQRGVEPGRSWFPFDQIDYIIGGLLVVYPLTELTLADMGVILLLFFGLHLITSYLGYLTGFKSRPI